MNTNTINKVEKIKEIKEIKLPSMESEKIVIHPFKGGGGLAEISQSMALKMALLRKNNENEFTQITPFVNCYDFLSDSYTSNSQKCDFRIYGFVFLGSKNSPDWRGVYLNLKWPNQKAKDNFIKNMHFIHEIEDNNNIPRFVFHDLGELNGMIEGNKEWLQNCLTTRLYMFFFRIFSYPIETNDWITELSKANHTDSLYIRNYNRQTLERILNDISSIYTDYFCGLDMKDSVSSLHHNSGPTSIFSTHTEQSSSAVRKNKHFQEMRNRGFETYIK